MIARTWGGKVPREHASGFHQHLLETGVRDYEGQSSCVEIQILRRDDGDWTHFLLVSVWQSLDAVRGYAGETPETAVLYPDDERFGLVPDLTVTHYDIAHSRPNSTPSTLSTPSTSHRPIRRAPRLP